MIDEATRVRLLRAFMGMSQGTFAATLGVSPATLYAWEKGKAVPAGRGRKALADLCEKQGFTMLKNGMPVPKADLKLKN